jgi:anti-anti-sigma regulatory factor
MKVKIDTKEKFHVISIEESALAANMTEDITQMLLPFLNTTVKNLIINLQQVNEIDVAMAQTLASIQQTFYEQNSSLVFCNIQNEVETFLDEKELLELMNVTPTESEAWDIVQMEEIEREFSDE